MVDRTLATAVAVLALATTACADGVGSDAAFGDASALGAAFNVVPAAFSNVESSYMGGADDDGFVGGLVGEVHGRHGRRPGGGEDHADRGPGRRGPGLGGLMGGGIFHGLDGLVNGGRVRVGDLTACTLSGARVTCPDVVRNGVTMSRSFAFATADGTPQAAPDATTDLVNARKTVTGTVTRRNGAATEVNHTSDRTVSGLAEGSTQRTVNATSNGTEKTEFTTDDGTAVSIEHSASDAVRGVIVPIVDGRVSYPTAGTVERTMTVTVTEGTETRTLTRTELLTYNGSDTATLVITVNGVTRNCSLPLPHGRPRCQ